MRLIEFFQPNLCFFQYEFQSILYASSVTPPWVYVLYSTVNHSLISFIVQLYNSTKALCFVSLLTAFVQYKQLVKSQITPKTSKAKVNLLALACKTLQDDHKQGSCKMARKLGRDQARLSFSFFS